MFLSRGDRDLGVAFQTHPGRQASISSGSKEPRSALESRRVSLGAHWVDSRESSLLRRLERGRETIGYMPEHPPLYDTLDVTQYLRFVAKAKGVPRSQAKSELDRVATACRLEAVLDKEIYKLSKGYRQRLGLAQALLGKPQVLLLDEPTAGLDPGQIHEAREVIRSFGEHHAVLLSTHILAEAALICRRVAIISQGRLLAIDSP